MIDLEFFNADGSAKTFEERQKWRAQQSRIQEHIQKQIAERTKKAETPDEQTLRKLNEWRATLKSERRAATQSDRSAIDKRLVMLDAQIADLDGKLSEEARIQKLSNHPAVKNAREHAEAFARTPPIGADREAVEFAVALVNSNECDNPAELASMYFSAVAGIEAEALNRAQSESLAKQADAAKAEAEAARAQAAALTTEGRLNHARAMQTAKEAEIRNNNA